MPSSGDCEVAVERAVLETEAHQFDTEMAAPVIMKDAKRHRSQPLQRECEWKQGDTAGGENREDPESASRWSAMGRLEVRSKNLFSEGGRLRDARASRWSAIHRIGDTTKIYA